MENEEEKNELPFRSLRWEGGIDGRFLILDQRKLPLRKEELELETAEDVFRAIRTLAVRGAPAIGAAAGYGLVLAARGGRNAEEIRRRLEEGKKYLADSRPTARNLFWALDRVAAAAENETEGEEILEALLAEARRIEEEDRRACSAIGRLGAELLPDPVHALTHCNAGALATCGIGTALAPFYVAAGNGREVTVYACEARPLLQGARLTAWELLQAGIEVRLLVDSARAHLMARGNVNCVVVGADRITRNGDTANKIGTYDLAVLAERHRIPFYVAAPASTFDLDAARGSEIPIEERDEEEVALCYEGRRIAPEGVRCLNPAFDVTPASLITAIVTEKGVIERPDEEKILRLLGPRSD